MSTSEGYRLDQLQRKAKAAFTRANPAYWKKVQGNPELAVQAKTVHDWARWIALRMETHIHKHSQKWIAQEAVKVFEERGRPDFEHPSPSWAIDQPVNVSYLEEARRRVQSRTQGRMSRINTAAERMLQAQEVRNRVPDLQATVLEIVKQTQEKRDKTNRHFNMNRARWVSEEQEKGSDNPEKDVYQRHRQRMVGINDTEHSLIRQAFKDHGHVLPERQEKTFVQNFNQAMG